MLKHKRLDGGHSDGGGPAGVDWPQQRLATAKLTVSEAANANDLSALARQRSHERRQRRQRRQAALAYRPRGGWSLGLW